MRQAWAVVCSTVFVMVIAAQVGWAQPTFRAEPLAIFGLAISDSGTIGGFRTGPQGTIQAAMQLTTGEVVTPMPEEAGVTTLVVDIDPGPLALIAWASERHASGDTARGYTYDHRSKRLTRLRHLPGARSCLPHAMNWSLQIVGECDSQAVYWRCATCAPTNLHRPDRWFGSVASAINRKGTLVLRAYYTDPPECGDCPATALYRRVASRTIVELPQPWGYVGGVSDINDGGVVVGYLSNEWDYLPVRWDATNQPQLIPLPPGFQPEAWPTAVNRYGQVVGQGAVDEGRFTFHAWTTLGDVAIDLAQAVPLEGGDWLSATFDVNRHGVILATSEAGASYRLVPQAPAMTTVSGGATRMAAGESDGVGGDDRSDR